MRLIGDAVLHEDKGERTEGVGSPRRLTPTSEKGAVDVSDHHIGPAHERGTRCILREDGAPEIVRSKVAQLDIRSGRTVEDDNALAQRLQVVAGGRVRIGRVVRGRAVRRSGPWPPNDTGAPLSHPPAPIASAVVAPKIYTRRGDEGTTGLLYGGRVRKDSWRIELNGAVDEAQAAIGLARAEAEPGSELDRRLDRAGS